MLHLCVLMYMIGNGLNYSKLPIHLSEDECQVNTLAFNSSLYSKIGEEWLRDESFPSVYTGED